MNNNKNAKNARRNCRDYTAEGRRVAEQERQKAHDTETDTVLGVMLAVGLTPIIVLEVATWLFQII